MTFMERMKSWLGMSSDSQPPINLEIREAMDYARYARRNEEYDRALSSLDRAMRLADEQKDPHSVTVISLHQADILIEQGNYEEAEKLLQTVQQTAEAVNQSGFASYALSSLGVLHQRRGEMTLALETFQQARELGKQAGSPGAEGRAMGHMADIYLHENNASYAVHLLQDALPMLKTAGDLELSSFFVGRLGEALIASGHESEGYQNLDRALRLGEQMRDKRMTRHWALVMANRAFDGHRYPRAYKLYKDALPLFDAQPTREYIDTLARTSRVCLALSEPEEALVYAKQAIQVANLGDDDNLKVMAEGALGIALRANNRDRDALPHLQAAVDAAAGQGSSMYIEQVRQLASAQAASGNTASAEATYRRAIEGATAPSLRVPLAEVRRDLGLLYIQQHRLSDAVNIWAEALTTFNAEGMANQVARLHCDIASARRQLGQGQRAIRDYEQALISLNDVDDLATRGLVLSNAANAYADQGDIESAESFFRESIDIAQKIEDEAAHATRLGNFGWFLTATGEPRRGIEKLTAALEISQAQGVPLRIAVQKDNLGLAYDALSQYNTALQHHEEALALLATLEPVPPRWQAVFMTNTARTKLALGRIDEASLMFDEALELARESNDFEALTIALIGGARLLLRQEDTSGAEPVIAEAIQTARKADLRRLLAEAVAVFSEQKAAMGDMNKARDLWTEAQRLYRMVGGPQARQTPFWLGTDPPDEPTT
jgi:tetratricopeptide (TPR) repeat protein